MEHEVVDAISHEGERELFRRNRVRARRDFAMDAKKEVTRLKSMLARSGLSQRDFAAQLGTSPSRLSTYLNGKVTPGADLLVKAERIGNMAARRHTRGR